MSQREHSFDLLRGLCLLLAIMQHWGGIAQYWYLGYGRILALPDHGERESGLLLKLDSLSATLVEAISPWSTHLFVALALFNLSRKTQHQVRTRLAADLKVYGGLFVFFTLENFVVSASFGERVSIYPLQIWMILFASLHIIYGYGGNRGVAFTFLVSLGLYLTPLHAWGEVFEAFMRSSVHPYFEYNARLEYFLPSASFGFLIGAFCRRAERVHMLFIAFVLFLILSAWAVMKLPFGVLRQGDIFAAEHVWSASLVGVLHILSIVGLVLVTAQIVERHWRVPPVPVLTWMGQNSLFLFAIHRILIVHVVLPVYLWFLSVQGLPFAISFGSAAAHALAVVGLTWLFQRMDLARVLQSQHESRSFS